LTGSAASGFPVATGILPAEIAGAWSVSSAGKMPATTFDRIRRRL
jgi:hypothetical protein